MVDENPNNACGIIDISFDIYRAVGLAGGLCMAVQPLVMTGALLARSANKQNEDELCTDRRWAAGIARGNRCVRSGVVDVLNVMLSSSGRQRSSAAAMHYPGGRRLVIGGRRSAAMAMAGNGCRARRAARCR